MKSLLNISEQHSDYNTMETLNLNDVLLNVVNPRLSDALSQPQDVNYELDEVNNFVESIFSEPAVCVVPKYSVKPIPKLVEFSEFNKYWHVRSGMTGNLSISFSFESKKKYCLLLVANICYFLL